MPLCSVDFPTIVYLVRRKAVERSNWSKVCRLELAQVGQQRQLSVLVAALVFPVTRPCQNQDSEDRILTPSHGAGALTMFPAVQHPGTLTGQKGGCSSWGGCGAL